MSQRLSRREPEPLIDLSSARHCHVVGIGGPGMSPLAKLLAGKGHVVSGSDIKDSEVIAELRRLGISITIGHDPRAVDGVDVVTFSTAIPDANVELGEARAKGIPVRHRSGLLASLCASTMSIGVAGTHGKTTTTALVTHILEHAGVDPSAIIGAEIPGHGVGARVGGSDVFVLEADESDGTLDVLTFDSLIITNVDVDHLDYFGSFDQIQKCFVAAVERARGAVIANVDDEGSSPVVTRLRASGRLTTFGTSTAADVRIIEAEPSDVGTNVVVQVGDESCAFTTSLRGLHNAMNCAAAIALALTKGVTLAEACVATSSFQGVARRFTSRGTFNGAILIDDYAHLPAEIESALSAARTHPALDGKLVAVFQPNRFHRIAAMADTYADCFTSADVVIITDVYASGTTFIEGVTGRLVVDAIAAAHPDCEVVWAQSREDIVRQLESRLNPGDICVSMGCGDIETLPDDLRRGAQ